MATSFLITIIKEGSKLALKLLLVDVFFNKQLDFIKPFSQFDSFAFLGVSTFTTFYQRWYQHWVLAWIIALF